MDSEEGEDVFQDIWAEQVVEKILTVCLAGNVPWRKVTPVDEPVPRSHWGPEDLGSVDPLS